VCVKWVRESHRFSLWFLCCDYKWEEQSHHCASFGFGGDQSGMVIYLAFDFLTKQLEFLSFYSFSLTLIDALDTLLVGISSIPFPLHYCITDILPLLVVCLWVKSEFLS
jgi:hypothetical protein